MRLLGMLTTNHGYRWPGVDIDGKYYETRFIYSRIKSY